MLRFLVGEPRTVAASTSSFLTDVDDAYVALFEFAQGLVAALEASRVATGWKGHHRIEVNGSRGSIWWDMEDTNRLHVFLAADEEAGLGGFRDVLVTSPSIRISASGGRRGTSSAGSTASSTSGATSKGSPRRSEPYPPGRRVRGRYRAAVLCEAIHIRAGGDESTIAADRSGDLEIQGNYSEGKRNEREQHAA